MFLLIVLSTIYKLCSKILDGSGTFSLVASYSSVKNFKNLKIFSHFSLNFSSDKNAQVLIFFWEFGKKAGIAGLAFFHYSFVKDVNHLLKRGNKIFSFFLFDEYSTSFPEK